MLDLNNPVDKEAFDRLHDLAFTMTGTNFALAMRNPDGTVTVYPRPRQPCQGGEMRKYFSTHGEKCTRPKDRRPSDLRMPFPDGVVEGVSINFGWYCRTMEFAQFLFSNESPYRNAYPSSSDIHLIPMKTDPELFQGLVVTNTDVDPTVFVNSLQCFKSLNHQFWKKYVDLGLTKNESLVVNMLHQYDLSNQIGPTNTYYFPMNASVSRLLEGNPFDLSGGTWRDGYDYNRPEVQDLFKAREGEVVTIFQKELEKHPNCTEKKIGDPRYPQYQRMVKHIPEDKIVETVRDIFNKGLGIGVEAPPKEVSIVIDIPNPKAEAKIKKPRKTNTVKAEKKEAA